MYCMFILHYKNNQDIIHFVIHFLLETPGGQNLQIEYLLNNLSDLHDILYVGCYSHGLSSLEKSGQLEHLTTRDTWCPKLAK